ncbi:hypothetical protein RRG51_03885 [Mycoplasmopsis cynos]|uniref:hypothetical protein n=1 Tax=Mycoplasmopsis cynos TaxID=171284 RepID=UPI002AFDE9AB|nr:hypothetical protein [Mycoplasmopsis cynos]WQQ16124.1 hypothetical protein RRG51_03885 [Mycoplasmopsis cynos]
MDVREFVYQPSFFALRGEILKIGELERTIIDDKEVFHLQLSLKVEVDEFGGTSLKVEPYIFEFAVFDEIAINLSKRDMFKENDFCYLQGYIMPGYVFGNCRLIVNRIVKE